jgi:hypothetical protein
MKMTQCRATLAYGARTILLLLALPLCAQTPTADPSKSAPPPAAKNAPKKVQNAPKGSAAKSEKVKQPPPPVKKTVVYDGGTVTSVGEVYPGVSNGGDAAEQQAAADWMRSADTNLRRLDELERAGKLSVDKVATKSQAATFLHQAREAAHEGDLPRARTLAQKAKLLSDSLLPK